MEPGGSSKIRVHGSNHQGTVFSIFEKLLTTEALVDVTLAAEGKFLRAHKVILSACSPYFEDLLAIDTSKHPILFMSPEVRLNELKALLDYLYKGETFIQQNDLPSLLKLAQYLQIRGLTETDDDDQQHGNGSGTTACTGPLPVGNGGAMKNPASGNSQISSRLTGNHQDESQNITNHSAVHLIEPSPESFLYNRVQELTNEQVPSTSGNSVTNRRVSGTKRTNKNLQHVPPNFIGTTSTTTSTFESHSTVLPQYGKRTCTEENNEQLNFPSATQFLIRSIDSDERVQQTQSQGYSFIDESSVDQLDVRTNSIKVEDGIAEEVILEDVISIASGDNPSLSQQNWLLQDTSRSNQGSGNGSRQDLEETGDTQPGNTEAINSSIYLENDDRETDLNINNSGLNNVSFVTAGSSTVQSCKELTSVNRHKPSPLQKRFVLVSKNHQRIASDVWKYFDYFSIENQSTCKVGQCSAKIKGKNTTNLKKHLRCFHIKEYNATWTGDMLKRRHPSTNALFATNFIEPGEGVTLNFNQATTQYYQSK